MADLLRWNSLGEAAEWLGHLTGKTWTLRGVLDAALIHTTQRRMQGGPSNLETAIAAALPHGHTLQAYVLNVDEGREQIERMTWLSPEARKASAVPVFTCSPRPVTLLQTDIAQLLQGGWVTLTVARNRHESEECNADGTPRYAVAIEPPATVRLEHLTIRSDHLTALGEALMAAAPRSETPASVPEGSADDEDDDWKPKARARALEIVRKRQQEQDLYPSQTEIADEIAREFRAAGIVGAERKPLTGAYIKRHALKGITSAKDKLLSTMKSRGK